MRRREQCLILTVLAVFALWWYVDSWRRQQSDPLEASRLREHSITSQTYVLQSERSLVFELPQAGNLVRILTTAGFSTDPDLQEPPQQERPGSPYSVQYEFLDSSDRVVQQGVYHFRTQLTEYENHESGEIFTATQFADAKLRPGNSREMRFHLDQFSTSVDRVRLRLADQHPAIGDVVARVYCRVKALERSYAWQRLSKAKRERLCRASVYTQDLLTPFEQQSLLQWQWLPSAPIGLEGRHYQRRALYTLRDVRGVEVGAGETPAGLLIREGRKGVVPLPELSGRVRLQCHVQKSDSAQDLHTQLAVKWYGKGVHRRHMQNFEIDEQSTAFELPVAGGLLEIAASQDMVLRADWRAEDLTSTGQWEEITPRSINLLTYRAGPDHPLDFCVEHADAKPTPLRIVLRALQSDRGLGQPPSPASSQQRPIPVNWELLDADGNVVAHEQIVHNEPVSLYDHVVGTSEPNQVSDGSSHYFAIPPDVCRIRLRPVGDSVLAVAYTRPSDIVKVTQVPEDYRPFYRNRDLRRSWFSLRSHEHHTLVEQARTVALALQTRPPEDAPELLAGRYQWEDYHPRGMWTGRYLLTPRSEGVATRPAAAAVVYTELEIGQDHLVELLARPGRADHRPSLVYLSSDKRPFDIKVYVDGQLHEQQRVDKICGELQLALLPVDSATSVLQVRIDTTEAARVFLNHATCAGQPTFLKRLANDFRDGQLEFDYEKKTDGNETLSVQFFRSGGHSDRTGMDVEVESVSSRNLGPYSSWTIAKRRFDLPPCGAESVPVLGSDGEWVEAGHTCFFPLASDLPPGNYTIRIGRKPEFRGYVVLSRTTTSLSPRRAIFTEVKRLTSTQSNLRSDHYFQSDSRTGISK